jgi:hypothetical protein
MVKAKDLSSEIIVLYNWFIQSYEKFIYPQKRRPEGRPLTNAKPV